MCGRYALTLPPDIVRAYFAYGDQPNFPPRYNIAPTQPIAIVRWDQGRRRFALARWGFLPAFVKDMREFPLIINARAEGIEDKPSFRSAIRRRRCLVPADGYYEWRSEGRGRKQPYLIRRPDHAPLAFAGIWETWHAADGSEMDTACIITCAANATVVAVHERMPVLIARDSFDLWLDPNSSGSDVLNLLRPATDEALELAAVSPRINKAGAEGEGVREFL